jgi:hypothetical protein
MNVLGDLCHELFREALIFKTFVHVVEKAATKQRVMKEFRTGTRCDFERILNGFDTFKTELLQPCLPFLCRWPFVQIGLESLSVRPSSLID